VKGHSFGLPVWVKSRDVSGLFSPVLRDKAAWPTVRQWWEARLHATVPCGMPRLLDCWVSPLPSPDSGAVRAVSAVWNGRVCAQGRRGAVSPAWVWGWYTGWPRLHSDHLYQWMWSEFSLFHCNYLDFTYF
jgi:hypothetical protein